MNSLSKTLASAFLAYSIHYGVGKLYTAVCIPDGLVGFVSGILSVGSPMCQIGLQTLTHTQSTFSSIALMSFSRILLDSIVPNQSSNSEKKEF